MSDGKAKEGAQKGGAGQWKIDSGTIEHVARLARIELTEEETKKFTAQLAGVLEAFRKIDEVDTAGVEPSFHPQPLQNEWREDEVKEWKWDPLDNTKHKEGKSFKGPRIV